MKEKINLSKRDKTLNIYKKTKQILEYFTNEKNNKTLAVTVFLEILEYTYKCRWIET